MADRLLDAAVALNDAPTGADAANPPGDSTATEVVEPWPVHDWIELPVKFSPQWQGLLRASLTTTNDGHAHIATTDYRVLRVDRAGALVFDVSALPAGATTPLDGPTVTRNFVHVNPKWAAYVGRWGSTGMVVTGHALPMGLPGEPTLSACVAARRFDGAVAFSESGAPGNSDAEFAAELQTGDVMIVDNGGTRPGGSRTRRLTPAGKVLWAMEQPELACRTVTTFANDDSLAVAQGTPLNAHANAPRVTERRTPQGGLVRRDEFVPDWLLNHSLAEFEGALHVSTAKFAEGKWGLRVRALDAKGLRFDHQLGPIVNKDGSAGPFTPSKAYEVVMDSAQGALADVDGASKFGVVTSAWLRMDAHGNVIWARDTPKG